MVEPPYEGFDGENDDTNGEVKARLADGLRKALVTGLSAVLVTEEGIRSALSDLRLPKDAMAYLVQQTDRTRKELFRVVSEEVKGFLRSKDLHAELRKMLAGLKLEVTAQVRFIDESHTETSLATEFSSADAAPPAPQPPAAAKPSKPKRRKTSKRKSKGS